MDAKVLMRNDLLNCIKNYTIRCLNKSVKWAGDLLGCLTNENDDALVGNMYEGMTISEFNSIILATSFYNLGEYKSAAHQVRTLKSNIGRFLYYYFEYIELQKAEWEFKSKNMGFGVFELVCSFIRKSSIENRYFSILEALNELECDGYLDYLKALNSLINTEFATTLLIQSLTAEPLLWPSWLELASITDNQNFDTLLSQLPKVWMRDFYILEVEKQLNITKLTSREWETFKRIGIMESIYLKSSQALQFKMINNIDLARTLFEEILASHPYYLDSIDVYSNILYLQQDLHSLTRLVYETISHSHFKPQTAFSIANLYNLANMHNEAALYFKQATKLDPNFTHAWTLLGHEFVELKDVPSAFASYKKAIELNSHEYRAWYGMGQVYELMKMPHQALPLFKKAYYLCPNDYKVSFAVARLLENVGDKTGCVEMLSIAVESGDLEGAATLKLAHYVETTDVVQAAYLYKKFLDIFDDKGLASSEDCANACIYLMNYHFETNDLVNAEIYARRGIRYYSSIKQSEHILNKLNEKKCTMQKLLLPTREPIFGGEKDEDDSNMALSP